MFRRKMTRAVTVIGAALVLMGSVGTSASASPASFSVSHHHAAGRGALAVHVEGGFTWHNRSVTLNDVWVFVKENECGDFSAHGYGQGDGDPELDVVANWRVYDLCASNQGIWFFAGDKVLDASDVYGGITFVRIHAIDKTHLALTEKDFHR